MPLNATHAHVAKNSRVLVVEDEWLIADEVCHQLLKAGYRVAGPVPSVRDALPFIDEVDAALLDYSLNDENSYQIAEQLAAHDIPFAFLDPVNPTILLAIELSTSTWLVAARVAIANRMPTAFVRSDIANRSLITSDNKNRPLNQASAVQIELRLIQVN